ncbi:MAG: ATP-grasp domain-containing protein [bacterium]
MKRFCLEMNGSTREKIAIISSARYLNYDYVYSKKALPDCIPIGSVDYCEEILPKGYPIEFFPDFLKEYTFREINYGHLDKIEKPLFLKKADCWKSDFESKVYNPNENIIPDFYYYSEPVQFKQEWRYYISEGCIISSGWYKGEDENEPAPNLIINFPEDFNAAVDFGRLSTGELAIIESHAPFACGWYGDTHFEYAMWQVEAWNGFLKNIRFA